MDAFTYPQEPHIRQHGPQGYARIASFRPWLRDEFSFRCVYCLLREQWALLPGMFDIDHYPRDLPDLASLRPPQGNMRPDGVRRSHFARQQANTLPKIY